jgi:phospholipase/carboxylesterase
MQGLPLGRRGSSHGRQFVTDHPLETVEIETARNPELAVIWLHGLGADGHDFEPIVPKLRLLAPTRFVFPHAPVRAVTINNGMRMRAWYDILGFDDAPDDAPGIRSSAAAVGRLVDRELERGIRAERIVLAGFSQGGAIALHLGLRESRRLGGIVALSTYLPLAVTLPSEKSAASEGLPIFLAHGRSDPLIPIELAEATRRVLEREGYSVEWHVYPMPHSVCVDEIGAIGAWLTRLARAGGS